MEHASSSTAAPKIQGYQIIKKIADAEIASVWLARQPKLNRELALKILKPEISAYRLVRKNFTDQARAIARLSHPSIVTIHDIGEFDGQFYVAMEYLPNGSLRERFSEISTLREAIEITICIAKALGFAHYHGSLHGDIKPENILFRASMNAVLTDFGLHRFDPSELELDLTSDATAYLSPEQLNGKSIDLRSDLYSLGLVFFEMLTSSLPGANLDTALAEKLPAHLNDLKSFFKKLLNPEKSERYDSARELIDALELVTASGNT